MTSRAERGARGLPHWRSRPHDTTPMEPMTEDIGAVAQLPWVQAIRPIALPYRARLSQHSGLEVWHVNVAFRAWPVPAELEERWRDTGAAAAATRS
jgi:hypothetical protein